MFCLILQLYIPTIFNFGVIIPILKKATLDPNVLDSYCPITLSSTCAKISEEFLIPDDNVSRDQYGFRAGRDTSMACNLIHDIMAHFKQQDSLLFVSSLDAAKCFDRVWHDGLFYKFTGKISKCFWLFLHTWYKNLNACMYE